MSARVESNITAIILTEDFFGVAYSSLISHLQDGDKNQRKDAFVAIRLMAKGAGLISGKDKVLTISKGCLPSGVKMITLVVETEAQMLVKTKGRPEIKELSSRVMTNLLEHGLGNSTWKDMYPDAYAELLKYQEDMTNSVYVTLR